MVEFLLRSEEGWALQHMKGALVALQGLLIILVGPKNIFNAPHPALRIPVWFLLFIGLIWTGGATIWMAIDKDVEWPDKFIIVFLALTCGLIFFATKKHRPIVYGFMEIAAGAIGMGVIAFLDWDHPTLALLFGGASSIYIVVRGLTNINDALVRRDDAPPATLASTPDDGLEAWEFSPEGETSPPRPVPADGLEPWEFPQEIEEDARR
ncbi:MAG: hypothetical protein Q7J28_12645 [Caulobacter sp.]|nr:hypothetical protein [Caulobacter sp.]